MMFLLINVRNLTNNNNRNFVFISIVNFFSIDKNTHELSFLSIFCLKLINQQSLFHRFKIIYISFSKFFSFAFSFEFISFFTCLNDRVDFDVVSFILN